MDHQLSLTFLDNSIGQKPKRKNQTKKKDTEKVYSVSEFIDYLNGLIQPINCTVQGEINRINDRGGVVYFTLCDKNEKAVLECLVWRSRLKSFGITLKEGLEVKIVGAANIYKPSGRFSFLANYISPVGEGALKQAFEQLKKKLEAEGCFDEQRKRPIPSYIRSIGLITSDSADAKKDFLTHFGDHGTRIYFYDVRVEGVRAIDTIVRAIRWFNENSPDVEVLVLTRGGGSLESLQAFNSEAVAKAIFSSKIPVMSAVGHENDVTIADLVADYRASTPTDAGKYLSDDWNNAPMRVDEIEQNIDAIFRRQCKELQNKLQSLQHIFLTSYKRSLEQNAARINAIDRSLSSSFQEMIRSFRHITDRYSFCFSQFLNIFSEKLKMLEALELYMYDFSVRWHKYLGKYLDGHEKHLSYSDPDLKLRQGYSITFDKTKKVLKSTQMVAIHDSVTIKLHSGQITAQVDVVE